MTYTNATTLVEFLRARLDATKLRGETLQALADAMRLRGFPESADLIAETGAQLLADVEAKRQIVDEHGSDGYGDCRVCLSAAYPEGVSMEAHPCTTLELLALPFAAHPDYDPSWRPAEVTA